MIVETRRSGVVWANETERACLIIDEAIPVDQTIDMKKLKKAEKYQDLKIEVQKLRNFRVDVIPVFTGTLVTIINEKQEKYLKVLMN